VLLLTARHLLVALVAGLAAGVGGGFALARMLASQLYGIESADASTLAVAAIVLVVLGSTASVGPLWRASRMDPGLTLKAS